MSFLVRAFSLLAFGSLAGCSLIFDFPEEGVLGGHGGGEPQGAENPSGTGGGGMQPIGGGPLGGGGGGVGGSPPACVFEPTFDWSLTLGTVDIDIRSKLAEGFDADGDLWVAGPMLGGQLNVNSNPVASTGDGANDVYLIEIGPDHDLKRGFVFGGTGWAFVYELAFAPDGRMALVGGFAGDMTFPGGITITGGAQANLAEPPTFDERDAWVAIFDPASETFPYAKAYGGGDGVYEEATSAKFFSNGDLLVSAAVEAGVLDWGGGATLIDGVTVARLDPTLAEVWKRQLDTNIALPGHVAMLPDDSFVVAATTYEDNVFGMTQSGESNYGGPDAFVAHYDGDGDWLWHRIFGDDNEQTSTNVAVGPSGDVYLAGTFKQGLQEKGGLTVHYSGAETEYFTEDIFFTRLATAQDGDTVWMQRIYGLGYQEAQDLTVGCGERVYITGDIADGGFAGVDFGDTVPVPTAATDTYEDLFYATYDGEGGSLITKQRVGDDWIELARGILLDPAGGFVLIGSFYESVFFDPALGGLLDNNDRSDIFVVRYSGTE